MQQHGTTIVRFLYLTIVRSILSIANLSRGPYHPKHPDPCMELKRRVGGYFKYTGGNYDKYALSRFLRLYKLYTEFSRSWDVGGTTDWGSGLRAVSVLAMVVGMFAALSLLPGDSARPAKLYRSSVTMITHYHVLDALNRTSTTHGLKFFTSNASSP